MGDIKTNTGAGGRILEMEDQLNLAIMRKEKVYKSGDNTVWGKPPLSLQQLGYVDGNNYIQIMEGVSNPKGIWHYLVLKPFAIKFCHSRTSASALTLRLSIANSAGGIISTTAVGATDISPIVQVQQNQRVAFLNTTSSAGTYSYHEDYWTYQILPYGLKEV